MCSQTWRRALRLGVILVFSLLVGHSYAAAQSEAPVKPTKTASVSGNSQDIQLLGHIGGDITAVYVDSRYAYIGEGPGLTILDMTRQPQPAVVGKSKLFTDIVQDVKVVGNIAYVADGAGGLHLIDVTNPAVPLELGVFQTATAANRVYVVGATAYVGTDASGLRIVDVANPAAPKELGAYQTVATIRGVFVVGNTAYLAASSDGLRVVDVSNPTAPKELGNFPTPLSANGVYVVGNTAYVAAYSGLYVIDVSTASAPKQLGIYQGGYMTGVYVVNTTAYVMRFDVHSPLVLRIVDVSNPAAPQELGEYQTTLSITGVYVVGTTAYVAAHSALHVVNASTPATPQEVTAYHTLYGLNNVDVVGNTAYVAATSGLHAIDVTNPFDPKESGANWAVVNANDVDVVGKTAYVATNSGLHAIDITNPSNLQELSTLSTVGNAYSVFVIDSRAYVAADHSGLHIMSAFNPAAIQEYSVYTATRITRGVFATYIPERAYVAAYLDGLRILDVTNPSTPKELGAYATPSYATNVFVVGNMAYVASELDGLHMIDVTLPAAPKEVGVYQRPSGISNVYVAADSYTAYVTSNGSLHVVDVANPAAPKEIVAYALPGQATGVFATNTAIYVTGSDSGLYILRYPPCYRLALHHTGTGTDPAATPLNSTGCLAGEYHLGELVTFSAHPADSWKVVSWVGTNNDKTESPTNVLTMPATDQAVTVNYAPTCYALTLTHSGTGGDPTATPPNSDGCAGGQYVAGQSITLHSTPGTGYTVGSWQGTANDSSTASDNTLIMPARVQTASVIYGLACYTLTLTHSGSGSDPSATPAQSPDCTAGHYHYNEPIKVTAAAAAGWQVTGWSGVIDNASTAFTNTLSMPPTDHTASVIYGEIQTTGPGDSYEIDNSCTRSRLITADGSEVQEHTFHAVADVDWVRFNATANVSYRIDVQVPVTSTADVNLELYDKCDGSLKGEWKESFSPGARLDFKAEAGGPLYIRLANQDATVAGDKVRYQLSVRSLDAGNANRALILVAGRLRGGDTLQSNINHVATEAYNVFQHNGYTDENIDFLATDATLPGYDVAVTRESLHTAIATWAKSHLQANGVLTLYLVDHGSPDLFYLDELSGQRLTPEDLDGWLSELETAVPGIKINVIIEACESGSFIVAPHSISKPGRLIITSSNAENDAKASKDGAYFSDHLLTWLRQGYNLAVGFNEARTVAQSVFTLQQAMLDGNGNGVTNEASDITLAAGRSFAYAGTLGDDWPPYIFAAQGPSTLTNFSGVLQADVRDNQSVREVWAVVYPPDYTPPPTGDVLQAETQPTILLSRVENGDLWRGTYTGFTQPGIYRIVIQADDNEGLKARPFVIEVNAGSRVFLPLVRR